jgi:hypothetical protein
LQYRFNPIWDWRCATAFSLESRQIFVINDCLGHGHWSNQTPISASWLNMVERFFRDLTVNTIRGGVFHSVGDLTRAIEEHITHHNKNPKPFVWTATATDILEKVKRGREKLVNM